MNASSATRPRKTLLQDGAYASGNAGKSALWSFFEIFGLFFLTDIYGAPPALAGTLLLISLIWDAATDPLIGYLIDRFSLRVRRATIYVLIGAPVTVLGFLGFFGAGAMPEGLQVAGLVAALLVFRTGYTIVDVPHNAMLGLLTDDPQRRTILATLRILASAVGKVMVTLLATLFIGIETDFKELGPWPFIAAIGLAVIYILFVALSFYSTRDTPISLGGTVSVLGLFQRLASSPMLQLILVIAAITSATTPIISAALVYFAQHGGIHGSSSALVWLAVAQALGLPLWTWLAARSLGKLGSAMLAQGLLLLAIAGLGTAFLVGGGINFTAFGVGIVLGGISMLSWAILPDVIDAKNIQDDAAYTVSIFGVYTFTNKVFIGLSSQIAGAILSASAYDPDTVTADQMAFLSAILLLPAAISALFIIACLRQLKSMFETS